MSRKLGSKIDRLGNSVFLPSPATNFRMVHKQGDVRDLLVKAHSVFCPEIMLAQQKPVIGGDHKSRIPPEIMGIEGVQKPAKQ